MIVLIEKRVSGRFIWIISPTLVNVYHLAIFEILTSHDFCKNAMSYKQNVCVPLFNVLVLGN